MMSNDWTTYDRWNEAVAAAIYPEVDDAVPVYLDLEDDLLTAVADHAGWSGDPKEGLRCAVHDAVVEGSEFTLARLNGRLQLWRRGDRTTPPPVLAFVALTVQAAEDMGQDDSFSSMAYYPRLAGLLGVSASVVRTAYMRYAEQFWRCLNQWLEDLDGARGLPTAYALQHRYVGLPVSQALVRQADRRHFPEFFAEYGLAGGMSMAPEALVPYLHAWFESESCPASKNLRRLWHKEAAQERIATVAAVELAEWDGTVLENQSDRLQPQRLGLMAQMRRGFMGTSLDISVTLRRPAGAADDSMEIESAAGAWIPVPFRPTVASVWRTGASDGLDIRSVLEGVLKVRAAGAPDTILRHPPRTIVPFAWDDLVHGYVEQERLQLNVQCMLLIKQEVSGRPIADEVAATIARCARPGFSIHRTLDGLPDGWAAIDSIQLFGAPVGTRFNELVPLARDQLVIAGGMRIPSRVRKWSSAAPPELRAAVHSQGIVRIRVTDSHREAPLREWEGNGGALVVPLQSEGLPDGDYRVSLLLGDSSTPAQELSLRLRSADSLDPGWHDVRRLTYQLATPLGVITAREHDSDSEGGILVDGACVEGQRTIDITEKIREPAEWTPAGGRPPVAPMIQVGAPDPKSCVVTGAHYIELPAYLGGKQPRFIEGRCRHCGLVKRSPGWIKPRRGTELARPQATALPPVVSVAALPPIAEQEPALWDSALDALMHLGGGSGASLGAVAAQIDGTALFTSAFPQVLEALGHVAIERNARGECQRWEISPTCLARLPSGAAELVGYWPAEQVNAMSADVRALGGELQIETRPDGPSRKTVRGVSSKALAKLQFDDMSIADEAGIRVLKALPPLSEVGRALAREPRPGFTQAEGFDTKAISWLQKFDLASPGAYRVRRGFETLYIYASPDDVAQRQVAPATVHLAKHLAANSAGSALAMYVAARRELLVPLGCDLPGLYARALVLCSGERPRQARATVGGSKTACLVYSEIDQGTADLLLTLLTS
ncbi:hypothetical protein [Kribbella speibonae]|uniref:Uncharacterized protein n=1 Tax=Kribbella speibonae TaxID=1572660 RepID=A0ABY2A5R7_9ACTN|nr:hypothetical protein [Kribbella speibonae]TCC22650.1 hypothetical protein E0H58_19870 [Kribbella speibonae]